MSTIQFEELMAKLNEISIKLEDKSTTLEESFFLFDEGLKISTQCADLLEGYSKRLEDLKSQWSELQDRIGSNNE